MPFLSKKPQNILTKQAEMELYTVKYQVLYGLIVLPSSFLRAGVRSEQATQAFIQFCLVNL